MEMVLNNKRLQLLLFVVCSFIFVEAKIGTVQEVEALFTGPNPKFLKLSEEEIEVLPSFEICGEVIWKHYATIIKSMNEDNAPRLARFLEKGLVNNVDKGSKELRVSAAKEVAKVLEGKKEAWDIYGVRYVINPGLYIFFNNNFFSFFILRNYVKKIPKIFRSK